MLTITRNPGERIVMTNTKTGEEVVVEFADYNTVQGARLRVSAPKHFTIDRDHAKPDRRDLPPHVRRRG